MPQTIAAVHYHRIGGAIYRAVLAALAGHQVTGLAHRHLFVAEVAGAAAAGCRRHALAATVASRGSIAGQTPAAWRAARAAQQVAPAPPGEQLAIWYRVLAPVAVAAVAVRALRVLVVQVVQAAPLAVAAVAVVLDSPRLSVVRVVQVAGANYGLWRKFEMRAALLDQSSVVINVIEVDSLSTLPNLVAAATSEIGDTWDGTQFVKPPATLPTLEDYDAALTARLDAEARTHRYADRISCSVRAGYPGPFQAEGVAFAQWMDACNAAGYAMLEDFVAGNIPQPTIAEVLAALPVMVWPT